MPRGKYYLTINGDVKCRYDQKIEVIDNFGPCAIPTGGCCFDLRQQLKVYKSCKHMNCMNLVCAKYLAKQNNKEAYLVISKTLLLSINYIARNQIEANSGFTMKKSTGTSLFMIKERLDVIDYIARITPTRAKFVFRQPKLSSIRNVYILPFDRKVWISTIALIGVFMLSMFFLIKWERAQSVFPTPHLTSLQLNDSLSDVAFVTIGAICQQGAASILYRTPGRIATFVLFLSLMFIYVSYSANIVALLQTSSNSIRTLEDLLNSRISVGADDTVYNRFFFANAEDSIRKSLYQKKIAPPGKLSNYIPMEEGVNRMRKSLFAFHMETGAGYKLVSEKFNEDEKCGLQEIEFLQVTDPWLAIQKNSPYKEILKVGLYLLQENGIHQRENNLIYTRKPVCTSKGSTFFSVGILDCYPAAAILAGGIAASVAIFIIELYLNCRLS